MRRWLMIASLALLAMSLAPARHAYAQITGGAGPGAGPGQDSGEDAAKKAKEDEEWGTDKQLAMPGKKNAGPCPYVKILYDAARYEEFKDDRVASDAVGFTGEMQNLSSGCEYRITDPIHVEVQVLFALGRGPAAEGATKDYSYWVAVTDRNNAVIDKQYFTVRAVFPPGVDRVMVTDRINDIRIPRANSDVSGANFEVLLGFDVTPQMADFNRQGKRFRVNAGAPSRLQ
jgi:hypothetical protein